MISKKKEVKQIHEGVAGKYVKKENPPEIPSKFVSLENFGKKINFFFLHAS